MAIFRTLLILLVFGAVLGAEDQAGRLFKAAERAHRSGDSLQAYQLYTQAALLDPSNAQYALSRSLLRDWATLSAEVSLGDDAEGDARRIAVDRSAPSDALLGRPALPLPRLAGSKEKRSFDLRGTARPVFEQVAAAYGVSVVFGDGYQGPASAFTLRMNDLTMAEAFHALETITNSFVVPVNPKLAIVYQDTAQLRTDNSPLETAEIPISERISVQDVKLMVMVLQQVLQIRQIGLDGGSHVVFIRDRPSTVLAARQVLDDISRNRAQVSIEVELLSVSKNSSSTYGLQLPNFAPVLNFGTFLHNVPATVAGISNFVMFGGGTTFMGIGVTGAQAFATESRSSSDSIFRAELTALDQQSVSLKVGDRYPIITNAYVGPGGPNDRSVVVPPPAIQFQDLGLILKVTPSVHRDGEITLDVDAEQNALNGSANNGIPVITTRHYQGTSRLVDGESAVVVGLMQNNVEEDHSGFPVLSRIPILGHLFATTTKTELVGQTLIVLKPHLLSVPQWEAPSPAMWVGTETKPLTIY